MVVFREPMTDELAIKRVAGRPGDEVPFAGGRLRSQDDEAWLLGDATDDAGSRRARDGPSTHDATAPSVRSTGRAGAVPLLAAAPGRAHPAGPPVETLLARGRTAPGPPPTAYGPVDLEALLAADREGELGAPRP